MKMAEQSPAWVFFSWAAFAVSVIAMGLAVAYMPMEGWLRGYLGIASLLLVQASFTLSKTLRDQYQAERSNNGITTIAAKEIV
jgi:hypothetical protein